MTSIREGIIAQAPPCLSDDEGAKVLFTMGAMLDAELEYTAHGIRARFPDYGSEDTLAAIGRDRQVIRGAFESGPTYGGRCRQWLANWALAGNPFAILAELRAYLAPYELRMRIVNRYGCWYTINPDGTREYVLNQSNWEWDALPEESGWARFWVILYPPATLWTRLPDFGDPALWGGAFGNPGYTWGSTARPEHVRTVRQIVDQRKDEKSACSHIIVSFDPALFAPGDAIPPNPSATWGNYSTVVGGVRQFTRSHDAIYWPGGPFNGE